MQLRRLVSVCLAFAVARAQDAGGNLTSTQGPTFFEGETVVHTVTVGLVGHTFDPTSLIANPGDKVMFQFYAGNHSFIQSLYGWPCVPEESIDGTPGINSGQFPNATASNPITWNLTINDTKPIWYYCGAPGSCINFGMLGAINPTNASEVEAQIAMAKQARYVLYPSDTLPAAAASSLSALASTILPQYWANETSQNMTAPTGSPAPSGGHHGLSHGAIAGIAVGAAAGLAIIGGLIFCLGRNKGQIKALKEHVRRDQNTQAPPQSQSPRPEMTVDGVTYVPAGQMGTISSNASYLPPYDRDGRMSPELRSKSPDSTVMPYSPPMSMHQFSSQYGSPPGFQNPGRFRESQELGIHAPAPQPRHELYVEPTVPEHETTDVERGPRYD